MMVKLVFLGGHIMQQLTITILLVIIFLAFPIYLYLDYNASKGYPPHDSKQYTIVKVRYKTTCDCHWRATYYGSLNQDSKEGDTEVPTTYQIGGSGHSGVRLDGNGEHLYQISTQSSRSSIEVR